MPRYQLTTRVAAPIERLWAFHEDPAVALPVLTPPGKQVRLVRVDRPMRSGSHVVMRVRLAPLVWVTWDALIEQHTPPTGFIDVALRGPFGAWRHEHRFEAVDERTSLLSDIIDYEPPLRPFGRLLLPWLARDIDSMFRFRHEVARSALE